MQAPHSSVLTQRVAALEALFRDIGQRRMAGVPILHASLGVEAVGFEPDAAGTTAVGVLVTPWFMNLMRLPLGAAAGPLLAVGESGTRVVGQERFDFIGAFEAGFGAYEACSLFSPMFEFVDHTAARATAQAVLEELRRPPPVVAERRALLFGRSRVGTGPTP